MIILLSRLNLGNEAFSAPFSGLPFKEDDNHGIERRASNERTEHRKRSQGNQEPRALARRRGIPHRPPTVESIGDLAFDCCGNLREVKLSEGLKTIGASAFGNAAIERIEMPSTVRRIGDSSFGGCRKLKSIELNEGLENIGKRAFGKTAVETIEMPSTLKTIKDQAFKNCGELRKGKARCQRASSISGASSQTFPF